MWTGWEEVNMSSIFRDIPNTDSTGVACVLFSRKIFPLQLQISHRNHSIKAIVAYLSFQATSSSRSMPKMKKRISQHRLNALRCNVKITHPDANSAIFLKNMVRVVGIRHNTLLSRYLSIFVKKNWAILFLWWLQAAWCHPWMAEHSFLRLLKLACSLMFLFLNIFHDFFSSSAL